MNELHVWNLYIWELEYLPQHQGLLMLQSGEGLLSSSESKKKS